MNERGFGLPPIQARVVGFLSHHENSTASDIMDAFSLSKSSVSEILSILVEKGLITYERCDDDSRKRAIELTDEGLEVSRALAERLGAFDQELVKGVTEEDLETVFRFFDIVRKNLEDAE
ncbi:MAG: MarR family winged helix-turn-helix transcriptional regulator [Candidatus Enteromonas sp.]